MARVLKGSHIFTFFSAPSLNLPVPFEDTLIPLLLQHCVIL